MKGVLFISMLSGGLLILYGCANKLLPEGHFQSNQVVIDGNITDWGIPLRFSNPAYTMQYSVTNDNRNIFVCVYTKDESFQKRILKAGMSICFDPKGEKDKKISLVFPVRKPDEPTDSRNGNPIRYSDSKAAEEQLITQSDYYNTIGFLNLENGQVDINYKQNNIQLAIKLNEDSSLVYEASIPIKYILGTDLQPGSKARNLSVGIVVNQLHHSSSNGSNGYRQHSPYGGGMRGMHGMGGGRNNNSNNNTAPRPEEDWYPFSLGYKKT